MKLDLNKKRIQMFGWRATFVAQPYGDNPVSYYFSKRAVVWHVVLWRWLKYHL